MVLGRNIKKACKWTLEKIVDAAPIIGAAAVGAATYAILDQGIIFSGLFQSVAYLDEPIKIINSAFVSFLAYNALHYYSHKDLVSRVKEIDMDKIRRLDFIVEAENKKSLARKAVDKIIDHPGLIMASIFAYITVPFAYDFLSVLPHNLEAVKKYPKIKEVWNLTLIDATINFSYRFFLGLFAAGIAGMGVDIFRIANRSGSLSFRGFSSYFYHKMGRYEKAIEHFEPILLEFPTKDNYLFQTKNCIMLKRFDDAAINLSKAFKAPDMGSMSKYGILGGNITYRAIKEYKRDIQKNPENVINYLQLSLAYIDLNKFDEAKILEGDIERRFPDNIDVKYLYALIEEGIGEKESARRRLKDVVDAIFRSRTIELKKMSIGDSRNQVFVYKPDSNSSISKSVVFKRGEDAGPIRHEYATNLLHYLAQIEEAKKRGEGMAFVNVPQPIGFIKHKAYFYSINRMKDAKNLDEIFHYKDEEGRKRCILTGVINIARLHGVSTRELGGKESRTITYNGEYYDLNFKNFNYEGELNRRIFDRVGRNIHSERITSMLLQGINDGHIASKQLLHGDYYGTQVLEDGTICDFETSCLGDPAVDISLFIGNPGYEGLFNMANAVDIYIDEFCEYQNGVKPSELLESIKSHDLFHSVCMFGSKHFHGDANNARKYFERAQRLAEERKLFDLKKEIKCYADNID